MTEDAEDVWITKRGQARSAGGRQPAGTLVVGVTPARCGAPASPTELVSMLSGGCEPDCLAAHQRPGGSQLDGAKPQGLTL